MNTMLGMQATSLHTPTEDSFSDLMKSEGNNNINNNDSLSGSGLMLAMGVPVAAGPAVATAASGFDLEVEEDDFDPDQLLKSPLFNDSAEKLAVEDIYQDEETLFGNFGAAGGGCGSGNGNGNMPCNNNNNNNIMNHMTRTAAQPKREFVPVGLRRSDDSSGFGPMKQQQPMMQHLNNLISYAQAPVCGGLGGEGGNGGDAMMHVGGNFSSSMMQQQPQQQQPPTFTSSGLDNVASFHSVGGGAMDTSQNSTMNFSSHNSNNNNGGGGGGGQFTSYRGGGGIQMTDDSSHAEFAHDDGNVNMVYPYLNNNNTQCSNNNNSKFYQTVPERTNSGTSSSYGSDMTPAPRAASTSMLDLSHDSLILSSAGGGGGSSSNSNNLGREGGFHRSVPQRSQTCHAGALSSSLMPQMGSINYNNSNNNESDHQMNQLQLMKQQLQQLQQLQHQVQLQQQQCVGGGGTSVVGGGNELEIMQQQLRQIQELDQMERQLQQQIMNNGSMMNNNANNNNNAGQSLSQSMHLPSRSASCRPIGELDGLGGESFQGGNMGGRRLGGMAGGGGGMGNDLEAMQQALMNGGGNMASGTNVAPPVSVNDAMEKLCVSMKRSAMSRTLVKQFSGRTTGVSRSRSGDGSMMVMALARQNMRHGGTGSMDDSSHRSADSRPAAPIRRISNTKHHLQPGNRGIYRHNSTTQMGAGSNHSMNGLGGGSGGGGMGSGGNLQLHIDGRKMGKL